MIIKLILILVIFISSVLPIQGSQLEATEFEAEIGINLGDGAGEIAEIIQNYLKDDPAYLIIYESMEVSEYDGEVVSTIMFFVNEGDEIKFYNQPLRTFLSIEDAEKVAAAINSENEADYLRVNLGYFIEIIDLYDGIEVETADGLREMDSKAAYDYLVNGLEAYDQYPFDHRERQELLVNSLVEKMDQSDGIPSLTGIISILYNGVQQIDSNRSFMGKVGIGIRFVNYGFENIEFYQPDPEDY